MTGRLRRRSVPATGGPRMGSAGGADRGSPQAAENGRTSGRALLCVQRGFFEGLEVPIDGSRLVIGRGLGADFVIAESTMSRRHAAVGRDGDGLYVEDLGSTNGTLVNGRPQQRAALRDGDEVRLGRLHLRVRVLSS